MPQGLFDIKSDNFLFGKNFHSLLILGGIGFLIWKSVKK